MLNWKEEFIYPDIGFEYHSKKLISGSACLLYTNLCYMWYMYNKKEWFYVSTKVILSKFNFKRANYFNSKKQLLKTGLIEINKEHYIKIPKMLEVSKNPKKANEWLDLKRSY